MTQTPQTYSLEILLEASSAAPEFKDAVRELARGGRPERIGFNWGAPPVKVLRVLKKILETQPGLAIERVQVNGTSGCSDFVGRAIVHPGGLKIDFEWDCRWQAHQLKWIDHYGDPDQIRAARQLDYQCFRRFEAVPEPVTKAKIN